MRCYFLRHGLAGDPERWPGADFDRPLTAEGQERMGREARTIAKLELGVDLIVTSPLVRAKQTATIVAERLKVALVEDRRLGLGFDADGLRAILSEHSDSSAVMVVGHEPSMSQTIGACVGGARIDFRKGSLACVNFVGQSLDGELLWLVPPKVLAL